MLPVPRPDGPPPEFVRAAWSAITVQTAWRLVSFGMSVRPRLLDDAREHVLRSLPSDCTVDDAEWLAPALVDEFLARKQGRGGHRVSPPELVVDEAPRRWREQLLGAVDRLGDACFRLHYADGLSIVDVASHLRVTSARIVAALSAVRLCAADIIQSEHPRLRPSDDELDQILSRLALYAEPGGPGPMGLLTPAGLAHADQCPRASRAVRLVRAGHLDVRALFPPRDGIADQQVDLLVVLLHPDGHGARGALVSGLGSHARSHGPNCWVISEGGIDRARDALLQLCSAGTPGRHHVRGVRIRGPGRWSREVLLGPLVTHALEAARARPWGEVAGLCELPPARPPPPRATVPWLVALAMGAAAVLAAAWVGRPVVTPPPAPIAASFSAVDGGWDVRFDTSDRASLDVIVEVDGALHVAHRDIRAAKGSWATGEGDFRLRVAGDGVAIVSSPAGVDQLEAFVHQSATSRSPLESLALALRKDAPEADIVVRPPLAIAGSL